MTNKRQIAAISGFVVLLLIGDIVVLRMTHKPVPTIESTSSRIYSIRELASYNGNDPTKPVLLGLDGQVFDVSSGRKEYYDPGKPYHFIAGTDASVPLHIAGASLIRKKYPVVGQYR